MTTPRDRREVLLEYRARTQQAQQQVRALTGDNDQLGRTLSDTRGPTRGLSRDAQGLGSSFIGAFLAGGLLGSTLGFISGQIRAVTGNVLGNSEAFLTLQDSLFNLFRELYRELGIDSWILRVADIIEVISAEIKPLIEDFKELYDDLGRPFPGEQPGGQPGGNAVGRTSQRVLGGVLGGANIIGETTGRIIQGIFGLQQNPIIQAQQAIGDRPERFLEGVLRGRQNIGEPPRLERLTDAELQQVFQQGGRGLLDRFRDEYDRRVYEFFGGESEYRTLGNRPGQQVVGEQQRTDGVIAGPEYIPPYLPEQPLERPARGGFSTTINFYGPVADHAQVAQMVQQGIARASQNPSLATPQTRFTGDYIDDLTFSYGE